MKKKILYAVACVALAAVAGWNYQQSQKESELSDLTLANVEALASGEGSEYGTLYGNSSGTLYCCCPGSTRTCAATRCANCP